MGGEAGQAVRCIYRRVKLDGPPPAPCLSCTCNADAGLGGGLRRAHHGPASSGGKSVSWLLSRSHFQREKTEAQRYREYSPPPQAAPLLSPPFSVSSKNLILPAIPGVQSRLGLRKSGHFHRVTLLRGFGPEGSQLCSQNSAFQLHEIWGFSVQEFYNYWAHHGIPSNWKLNCAFPMQFVAKETDLSELRGHVL